MKERFAEPLESRPRGPLAVILILAVALVLVSVALALDLTHFGRPPYPSNKIIPMSLVDGKVVYTQDSTNILGENMTPAQSFPYTGMKIDFQVETANSIVQTPVMDFGNQTELTLGNNATMSQVLIDSTIVVSIKITDVAGDGSFDFGDTVVFDIAPLEEGAVYTWGLLWLSPDHHAAMILEDSFAIDHGKLYAWFSKALDDTPWYQPYWPPP